ncbi:MAG TPA: SH3 domain-containing protein, partial [Anaerolineales bacterium]|nr:SH3 domain-containing protein [Anaerolineales bacterium]
MTPGPTQFVTTPTLPLTTTTTALETALPSSLPPTLAPVDGITSTQVNVRAEPSTAGTVLGIIPADMRVEITGKDPGGNWWQINYPHPEAMDGKGWV